MPSRLLRGAAELIRPLIPGEVVRNMMGVPTAGVIAAGACIQ